MSKETPEERQARLERQLEAAREAARKKREEVAAQKAAGTYVEPEKKAKRKRPKHLDKIIREILDDDTLVDKVIQNQPEYWDRLPVKNGGYIISTVMMVKAMGGDIKAAEWIRKTGFGDKVMLESEDGFFQKDQFTIHVVPSKELNDGIKSQDVIDSEIKQIEDQE